MIIYSMVEWQTLTVRDVICELRNGKRFETVQGNLDAVWPTGES